MPLRVVVRCRICGAVIVSREYNGPGETYSQILDLRAYLRHLEEKHPEAEREISRVKKEIAYLESLLLEELSAPL